MYTLHLVLTLIDRSLLERVLERFDGVDASSTVTALAAARTGSLGFGHLYPVQAMVNNLYHLDGSQMETSIGI
jgi:hypothetical protein